MSAIQDHVVKRFAELAFQADEIPVGGRSGDLVEDKAFHAWAGAALNAMHGVFGSSSPHYVRMESALSRISENYVHDRTLQACKGIFLGAKSDVDGGHIFRLSVTLSGEIFGDFVAVAKVALSEGKHAVAAVLACAALEDALKRFAAAKGLDVDDKTMEQVINALKSGGFVSGAQKGLLAAMPKLRNLAMHAEWDKLTPQDVGSVVGFVEQFLLLNFSD